MSGARPILAHAALAGVIIATFLRLSRVGARWLAGAGKRQYCGETGSKVATILAYDVKAKNLRGVIKAMGQLYPGLSHHLETTVAIDGAIHETAYFRPIRPGCEVFFIPKLEGG
jgi:hypothetical protein